MNTQHLTENADSSARAKWFFGIAKDLVEGVFPDLNDQEAELLSKLSQRAESFVMNKVENGVFAEGSLSSLATVAVLRSSGTIPGRKVSDFVVGQAVHDLRDHRRGTVVGESIVTDELAIHYVGEDQPVFVRVENIVSLPHVQMSSMDRIEAKFDETATARWNGMALRPRDHKYNAIVREQYGYIVESNNGFYLHMDSDVAPFNIPLVAKSLAKPQQLRESIQSSSQDIRGMMSQYRQFQESRRIEEVAASKSNEEIAESPKPSQIIFEAIMRCPGSPKDAVWMADYLSRHESLLEATEQAYKAESEVPRSIMLNSLEEAELAFVQEHKHAPSLTHIVEQMALMTGPKAPNRIGGVVGSRAASRPQELRMGTPNRVYVKRKSEILQGAGKAQANADAVFNIEHHARQAQIAANKALNNPEQVSANRALATNIIDLFTTLFNHSGEPWNPIRTSSQPTKPEAQNNESAYYEIDEPLVEEIINDISKILKENEEIPNTLIAGKPIRIRPQRPSTVYSAIKDKSPDPKKIETLKGLLTSIRTAARLVKGQPGSRTYHKRLAAALLMFLNFVTQSSAEPWGVLDVA